MLAVQHVDMDEVPGGLRHVEIYTTSGLLTLLWHGPVRADRVVVCVGGAMGGLLGPANGLYHDLGLLLAAEGIGTMRVSYRAPNVLDACVGDAIAAAMMAEREGAERFVVLGHSFGGAVAVGTALPGSPVGDAVVGVCTLATQSAGCEGARALGARPFLLLHGDSDEILPAEASLMVQAIAGTGDVEILAGAGHLLGENGADLALRTRVPAFIRSAFSRKR